MPPVVDRATKEERDVHNWRLARFRELTCKGGPAFSRGEANLLEASGADWREAKRLLDRGAQPLHVLLILI